MIKYLKYLKKIEIQTSSSSSCCSKQIVNEFSRFVISELKISLITISAIVFPNLISFDINEFDPVTNETEIVESSETILFGIINVPTLFPLFEINSKILSSLPLLLLLDKSSSSNPPSHWLFEQISIDDVGITIFLDGDIEFVLLCEFEFELIFNDFDELWVGNGSTISRIIDLLILIELVDEFDELGDIDEDNDISDVDGDSEMDILLDVEDDFDGFGVLVTLGSFDKDGSGLVLLELDCDGDGVLLNVTLLVVDFDEDNDILGGIAVNIKSIDAIFDNPPWISFNW